MTFCTDGEFIISDYAYFGRDFDKYTYVSDSHGTTSWLDHLICSHDLHSNIVEMKILEKNPCSDHLPICARFTLEFCSKIIDSSTVTDRDAMLLTINCQWAKAMH